MTLEIGRFTEMPELLASVLQALDGHPMCFLDLCRHFKVPTEVGDDEPYSPGYLRLLNAVTRLQSDPHVRKVATAMRKAEGGCPREHVLYLIDDEKNLEDWGLQKPDWGYKKRKRS